MVNTLYHMVFQCKCQPHLAITVVILINHVFFHGSFSTKACHWFGRPQTYELNIYICVGTSSIGWLDGEHTLPRGFSVPAKSCNYCCHAHQPCVFPCFLLNQGMSWVWNASNMGTKHIYMCGNKFNWVVG